MSTRETGPAGQNSQTPSIQISHLTKTFRRVGGKTVTPVNDFTLSVGKDEMVVLLGPSGCGKTTLLRCVAGLERPEAGEISIDGQVVFSSSRRVFVPPDRRRLSMIFQSFALWPHMTVFGNVAYPIETLGLSRAEIARRVAEVLEIVGVKGLEDQYPGKLSGGQQQRVALARALVGKTSVVLFDEPLSNVDALVRVQLRIELKRMQQQLGFAGLYVTHDQTEAMELGHRVAVIDDGRIAACGEPRAVYEHPQTQYVANFLGAANMLPGKVVGHDGVYVRVETAIGELRMAATDRSGTTTPTSGLTDDVVVVIRPEKFRLTTQHPAKAVNCFAARVVTSMFGGSHTEYVVECGTETVRVWTHDDGEMRSLIDGGPAWLSVDPDRVRAVPAGSNAVRQ